MPIENSLEGGVNATRHARARDPGRADRRRAVPPSRIVLPDRAAVRSRSTDRRVTRTPGARAVRDLAAHPCRTPRWPPSRPPTPCVRAEDDRGSSRRSEAAVAARALRSRCAGLRSRGRSRPRHALRGLARRPDRRDARPGKTSLDVLGAVSTPRPGWSRASRSSPSRGQPHSDRVPPATRLGQVHVLPRSRRLRGRPGGGRRSTVLALLAEVV